MVLFKKKPLGKIFITGIFVFCIFNILKSALLPIWNYQPDIVIICHPPLYATHQLVCLPIPHANQRNGREGQHTAQSSETTIHCCNLTYVSYASP